MVFRADRQTDSVLAVLECGTGSGSLTHALARAVGPTGHVHTFEFHDQRAKVAAAEFTDHGLDCIVDVTQRDIEQQGFPENLHGRADAVFLDVPGPWRVSADLLRTRQTFYGKDCMLATIGSPQLSSGAPCCCMACRLCHAEHIVLCCIILQPADVLQPTPWCNVNTCQCMWALEHRGYYLKAGVL